MQKIKTQYLNCDDDIDISVICARGLIPVINCIFPYQDNKQILHGLNTILNQIKTTNFPRQLILTVVQD